MAAHRMTSFALLTLAAVCTLSTPSTAQTYEARSGLPQAYLGGDDMVESVPTFSLLKSPTAKNLQESWGSAGPGELEIYARAEHWAAGSYQVDAGSRTVYDFDDVIFSSGGSGPINVGLLLTVDGYATQAIGGQLRLYLRDGNTIIGTAILGGSGVKTTGVLNGYSMQGPFSFQYDYTANVNVPERLKITMEVQALTGVGGWKAAAQYQLSFGAANPSAPTPVYVLPNGVTVDSVQAGIQNNLWEASPELYLTPSEPIFDPGETLDVTVWNGVPTNIFVLMVTDVSGVPYTKVLVLLPLDADGKFSVGTFLHDPALAGISFGLLGLSLDANNAALVTAPKTVTVN